MDVVKFTLVNALLVTSETRPVDEDDIDSGGVDIGGEDPGVRPR